VAAKRGQRSPNHGCANVVPLRLQLFALTIVAALIAGISPQTAAQSQDTDQRRGHGSVVVIDVRGAIGVGTSHFIQQSLAEAKQRNARLLIMQLDTPGGLVSATREIIQSILASPVPVAVYVAPSGARAASAGTYISYAAHFAAMAPGTHLGAATPIQMGTPGTPSPLPSPSDKEKSKPGEGSAMERKIVNDAVSYLRSMAELRGRNAEWAEKAVREAATLTSSEALKERVIDVVATDVGDLLEQLDGRTFRASDGEQKLAVRNALVVPIEAGWRTRLLTTITDPNVAFILLMIGVYGIIFEFWSPGLTGPGIVGGVALIVALAALSALPISYAGMALLALGLGLMIAEAVAPGFGILGLGGSVAFALGAVFLFDPDGADIDFAVAWPVVISATLTSALLLVGLLGYLMKSRSAKVVTGSEEMIGLVGRVVSWTVDPSGHGEGRVAVHGETWSARATVPLAVGQSVTVVERSGLVLTVAPVNQRR
jgi:membrane-bound serine protease (ClpP class)